MKAAESETLEFKASFGEWKEAIHTLAAFANTQGGTLAVGLDDGGQPTGLVVGKGTIEDFLNKVHLNTDPVLYPSVAVRVFGPDQYVEITVPPSDERPVFAFDRAYVRVGRTTQKLSATAVRQMVLRYGAASFDEASVPLTRSKFALSPQLKRRPGVAALLKDPWLWHGDHPTAALYLSLCDSNAYHPQASLQAGLFKGTNTAVFIDMKTFEAPLLVALEDAMGFVRKHLSMAVVLDGAPQRKEVWAVPLPAIREALINAVVHRDYTDPGQVQVRMFDDRLEIWSPGLLATGIALDQLGKQDRSQPRNRRLARIFQRVGVIESFGTGFQRMEQACRDAGAAAPVYSEQAGAFVVTFPYRLSLKTPPVAPPVALSVTPPVTPPVKTLLEAIGDKVWSREELMHRMKLGDKGHFLKSYLEPALNAGLIERTIPDKPNSRLQKYRKRGAPAG